MTLLRTIGVVVLVASMSSACRAAADTARHTDHCNDRPDWSGETLVKTPDQALRIAFATWYATNPKFKNEDEQTWSLDYTATLHNCIWEVALKPKPHYPRRLVINIGAVDGRFLGVIIGD